MDACDVVIVGAGPAGSACAWRLGAAGLDVRVLDGAAFPRDKVCAGWVTPQVFEALQLDPLAYARGHTLQPLDRFRVGTIGGRAESAVAYGRAMSYGVRRCEFDAYLLHRSGARQALGTPVTTIRRDGTQWILNETYRAPILVGAGGHRCPVARWLNGPSGDPVVAAQEIDVPASQVPGGDRLVPGVVALYFRSDLTGYGWCYRKHTYVNIGFGQYGGGDIRRGLTAFLAHLVSRGLLTAQPDARWHGHAYRVSRDRQPRVVADGLLLVGDAAGLAYPASGEGIRPAIESGLLAAATILDARGRYDDGTLREYERRVSERLGATRHPQTGRERWTRRMAEAVVPSLLASPWLVRRILLDRWFLHANEHALAA